MKVLSMSSKPHDVNVALARCDLERVVSDYLRGGADPARLLGELLEMCMNLRELAEDIANGRRPYDAERADWRNFGLMSSLPDRSLTGSSREFAGMNVRWLRPVAGLSRSPGGHHVERKPDTDKGLSHD